MIGRFTRRAMIAGLLAAAASSAGSRAGAQERVRFRVIVHPENPVTAMERKALVQMFLKKSTVWSETGEVIRPADLTADSPVRRDFSEAVLGRSVAAVKSYWQQMIFSGRAVPPPELDSEDAVIRYVLKHPGAIGYVSGAADLRGAKVLSVR